MVYCVAEREFSFSCRPHCTVNYPCAFNVSHPVVFLKFIQETNSSQTQPFYDIIIFKPKI
jgi:hypothetical protein